MIKQNQELIYLDGMWLRQEHLLNLAMGVGNYAQAEHYLFALLADAVLKGKGEAILEVNKVRVHYGLKPIPLSNDLEDADFSGNPKQSSAEKKTKSLFNTMSKEDRIDVLRRCIALLLSDYHLFIYARHWLGIFMVIRDQLFGGCLSQAEFLSLAIKITPDELPKKLRICKNTIKNFGREVGEDDRGQAYYRMHCNPQKELCDTFWAIIQETILTAN